MPGLFSWNKDNPCKVYSCLGSFPHHDIDITADCSWALILTLDTSEEHDAMGSININTAIKEEKNLMCLRIRFTSDKCRLGLAVTLRYIKGNIRLLIQIVKLIIACTGNEHSA